MAHTIVRDPMADRGTVHHGDGGRDPFGCGIQPPGTKQDRNTNHADLNCMKFNLIELYIYRYFIKLTSKAHFSGHILVTDPNFGPGFVSFSFCTSVRCLRVV